jgi:hypothetical protein
MTPSSIGIEHQHRIEMRWHDSLLTAPSSYLLALEGFQTLIVYSLVLNSNPIEACSVPDIEKRGC